MEKDFIDIMYDALENNGLNTVDDFKKILQEIDVVITYDASDIKEIDSEEKILILKDN